MEAPTNRHLTESSEPLTKVLEYFRELSLQAARPAQDVQEYPVVVWLWELQALPDVRCPKLSAGNWTHEFWIQWKKPVIPDLPPFPEASLPWVPPREEISDSSPPRLREKTWREGKWLELASFPAVQNQWERWIDSCWQPWAEQHRKAKRAEELYYRLVWLEGDWKRKAATHELVMAFGLLTWSRPTGAYLRRHLLVASVEIRWERGSVLTVAPSPLGFRPRIEWEVLEGLQKPDPERRELCDRWANNLIDPWNREETERILRGLLGLLPVKGDYLPSLEPGPQAGEFPRVWLAPALLFRKRSCAQWASLAIELREQRRQAKAFPVGELLFESRSQEAVIKADRQELRPTRIPLALSIDQKEALEAVKNSRVVLIDGPPSSGKTQTAASLLGDFLAHGKKVLVVGTSSSLLRKLWERIPPEIRPLCLCWTGIDSEFLSNLETAVDRILRFTTEHSPEETAEEVARWEGKIREVETELLEVEETLLRSLPCDTRDVSLAGGIYQGSLPEVIERLFLEREKYHWFTDAVDPEASLPESPDAWKKLASFLRPLSLEKNGELSQFCPDPALLPEPSVLASWLEEERKNRLRWQSFLQNYAQETILQRVHKDSSQLQEILAALSELRAALHDIRNCSLPFAGSALDEVVYGNAEPWVRLQEQTQALWDAGLAERVARVKDWTLATVKSCDLVTLLSDCHALLQYWEEKGPPPRFLLFRPRVLRETSYLRSSVRLNGRRCRSKETLQDLQEYCQTYLDVRRLCRLWQRWAEIPVSGGIEDQLDVVQKCHHWLGKILAFGQQVKEWRARVELLFAPTEVAWTNEQALGELIAQLLATLAFQNWEKSEQPVRAFLHQLHLWARQPNAHPILGELLRSVEQKDPLAYELAYGELVKTWEKGKAWEEAERLLQVLGQVAPDLTRRIKEKPADPAWPSRLEALPMAWQWARAWAEVRQRAQKEREILKLWDRYQTLGQNWRREACALWAAEAWLRSVPHLEEEQREALLAWKKAWEDARVRFQPSSELYRREAWKHTTRFVSFFPAWLIGLPAGMELLSENANLFDVVIVIGGEVAPPPSLLTTLLGRKVAVLGDGSQPGLGPFLEFSDPSQREDCTRWVADLAYRDRLVAANSLWDIAEVRFPVRKSLRRQFSSRAELVALLNSHSYPDRPLLPMRIRPTSFQKVLRWEHISQGVQQGSGHLALNPFEAHAVVEKLRQILEDPFYASKTIALVSLGSVPQANLLRRLSNEKLPSQEIARRNFFCGTPEDLQGESRDLVFVSLVVAPNEPLTPWPEGWGRRLVHAILAAAKEEIWVFHSAPPEYFPEHDPRLSLFRPPSGLATTSQVQLVETVRGTDGWHKEMAEWITGLGYAVYTPVTLLGEVLLPADLLVFGTTGVVGIIGPFALERWKMDGKKLLSLQQEWEACGYHFVPIPSFGWAADRDWVQSMLREALLTHAGEPLCQGR
ncbi:DEAD/DEAH box helicase family protein [Candidatus Methylacidithermus pantelleriae]|uniref:DNA2/NAM7 helicase helicase domain-containing protein n=1 Tax=Candidatus Methylacidithermus pantelleriae TaxID=2744239 RepID=A0A8J2BN54_9BACT|nr:hypothetical protein [Candidatus Methylacidithermus pantelleriae]CAF0692424.1 hypothetical protein MPNT_120013 [Candidatus Methylacidithermus pantelleriae]